ncbi:peptidoglycan DD-metalloendopeptidase family protein [Mangrovihabitans endophyticus]|uniref:M23ase beta-sheet core domain-containing protein n=1 Tax=Mangrovihabitans endophyticus TaxID=1751298 RepID=A0A8J3FMG9_9ACTN|nr:peptidoglycan DD-metalloendopeptidase family protein [Mangrovihabitans endophyticus]GGK83040.1 hypothetical protein GCM10012284_16440 [Mangrovihabitans endophyticus]
MQRRHQRRAMFAAVAVITAILPFAVAPASAAQAASRIAGYGKVVVSGSARLAMRTGPSLGYPSVGAIRNDGNVGIMCRVLGKPLNGTVRYTGLWDRLTNGAYVSDAFIRRGAFRIPVCTDTPTYVPPVYAGLSSAFRTATRPTHDGVDLSAARYTPIRAAAAGRVTRVRCNASTNNCDVDGSRNISGCGWYAEISHPDGFLTRYCHMYRRPSVSVGQSVAQGQVIGYVGSSGASSGPHLHFEVHAGNPATRANAMNPIWFMRRYGQYFG